MKLSPLVGIMMSLYRRPAMNLLSSMAQSGQNHAPSINSAQRGHIESPHRAQTIVAGLLWILHLMVTSLCLSVMAQLLLLLTYPNRFRSPMQQKMTIVVTDKPCGWHDAQTSS